MWAHADLAWTTQNPLLHWKKPDGVSPVWCSNLLVVWRRPGVLITRYSLSFLPPSVTTHKYLVSMCIHDRPGTKLSRRILRGFDRDAFVHVRTTLARMEIGDLARIADVGATTIYGWEKGTRTPQVDTLARVIEVLAAELGPGSLTLADVIRVPPNERTLADLRNLAGLTQPQLALKAGLRTTALSKIERAEIPLSKVRAAAIAEAIDVDIATVVAAYARAKARPAGAPA